MISDMVHLQMIPNLKKKSFHSNQIFCIDGTDKLGHFFEQEFSSNGLKRGAKNLIYFGTYYMDVTNWLTVGMKFLGKVHKSLLCWVFHSTTRSHPIQTI